MCQVVLRRDPFDEQTEGQASSSWGWEQFAKYLPIGRFCERSIGRNRIGFPHINICQVFLRDLEHTHTHKVGGSDLLFLRLGAICGARRGRIQWPEWLLPAIVFVFYELGAIVFVLHCIVLHLGAIARFVRNEISVGHQRRRCSTTPGNILSSK